jgi:hypothetical protein
MRRVKGAILPSRGRWSPGAQPSAHLPGQNAAELEAEQAAVDNCTAPSYVGQEGHDKIVTGHSPPPMRPDILVRHLSSATTPPWRSTVPVPLVGLATAWDLQWHAQQRYLRRCELVLTDLPGLNVSTARRLPFLASAFSCEFASHLRQATGQGAAPRILRYGARPASQPCRLDSYGKDVGGLGPARGTPGHEQTPRDPICPYLSASTEFCENCSLTNALCLFIIRAGAATRRVARCPASPHASAGRRAHVVHTTPGNCPPIAPPPDCATVSKRSFW